MGHLTFELILWLLLAFFIGCILGCLFRKLLGGSLGQGKAVAVAKISEPMAEKKPQAMPAVATGVAKRPKGLAGARNNQPDQLQRISGIGPKLDKTLHSLGYFHYDQIAKWSPDEVQWVDEHLRFKGRIEREKWIPQAKLLVAGNEEDFARLYGTGGMKSGQSGKAQSGELTRRATSTKPAAKKTPVAQKAKTTRKAKPAVATGIAKAPKKLKKAKGGKADDLQRISGVGPKLETTLQRLGFFHFDQIATWTPDEVLWVDENLRFKGRIDREEWIAQSKLLAAGDEKKFARRYGSGGVKDKKTGKSKSGTRTRKS